MAALKGQRILLTGGGTGLGLAFMKALEGRGNKWLITGRTESALQDAAGQATDVQYTVADVAKPEDRTRLISDAKEKLGGLDVLVNNAGVQFYPKFTEAPDPAKLAAEVDINLTAPITLAAEAIPALREGTEPMIINIASTLAMAPKQVAPVYCATKAGLASFSRGLRYQLESTGIRVVTVYPPLVASPMTEGRAKGAMKPEKYGAEVVKKIDQGKDEVLVGGSTAIWWLQRFAPGLSYRIVKNASGSD